MKLEPNPKHLRETQRQIASVVLISADNKILMGRTHAGGVYPDTWHIPGGGVDEGETMEEAARRECLEEVGLDLHGYSLKQLPYVDKGETTKTLKSGEQVWVKMTFNRFEVRLDRPAADVKVKAGDDMHSLHWFDQAELAAAEQIPGGREFFMQAGYLPRS